MLPDLSSPSSTTYEAISLLLNAPTPAERDELTKQWRDHKLAELNFIGIVGGLIASCLTSTGSWPTVLPDNTEAPWTVRMFWYAGVILSFASVLSAAFQTIRLHRLSTHRDALREIRRIMASRPTRKDAASGGCADGDGERAGGGEVKPKLLQVYAWQSSMVFLSLSVACMISGMFVLVWSSTGTYVDQRWWDGYAKVAVTLTVILSATVAVFTVLQLSLYPAQDDSVRLD